MVGSYADGLSVSANFYRWRPAYRARFYKFDKYSIRLGTLYFKRLAARVPAVLRHAQESSDYRLLVRDVRPSEQLCGHVIGLDYLQQR